ncbi:MAG: four helix bundle suffix domain-containing protein [Muribaculaceae bacterium]|nr:four helix bundle suffix domain-containing protein [Muribaculaceae bacterium]
MLTYQLAMKISAVTEIFVERFISKGSRTIDQMQQAARSCKQNIVEGSAAASTSKETEIKLTNVARASLSELEEDYVDYLTFHHLKRWTKDNPRTLQLRKYIKSEKFDSEYISLCQRLPAEEYCNMAITLIKQTQYLLDRLLQFQQRRFIEQGGIREAMASARREYRSNLNQNNWSYQNNWNNPTNNSNSSNNSNNSNNSNSSNM